MISKAVLFLVGSLVVANPLSSQPTWRTAGLLGTVLQMSPPGTCAATWYDPEPFVLPDGNRAFLAQGGQANSCTANVGLDSLFSAHTATTGAWQLPAAGSCPRLVGHYAGFSCPTQEFFAPYQPLASPAIAKVGSRYYMAFSGGNADYRKGHIFWAYSDNGLNWVTFKWDPKPMGYNWRPLIYPNYGDFCERFGLTQVSLTYDPSTEYGPEGTFYLHTAYVHRTDSTRDTYTFRFRYSSAFAFGIGTGMQVCLNSGPPGTPCAWANHSGAMVFDYDGQPAQGTDPVLVKSGGNVNNFARWGGSIVWDPSHNYWLRVFRPLLNSPLQWQSTTSLSSGIWSTPQTVDMTQFHQQVLASHPNYVQGEVYYGGLWWGRIGSRTGMWLYQPADYRGCSGPFTGLGIFIVALNFS